jgi:hypothetical protein
LRSTDDAKTIFAGLLTKHGLVFFGEASSTHRGTWIKTSIYSLARKMLPQEALTLLLFKIFGSGTVESKA